MYGVPSLCKVVCFILYPLHYMTKSHHVAPYQNCTGKSTTKNDLQENVVYE